MRVARRAFVIICWAYLVLLPIQFAVAGMGVMGGSLEPHFLLGGMLLHIVIPALLLILALIGRTWGLAGWAFVLFAVLTLQIAMVDIGRSMDSTLVAGLHPFVAFLTWPLVYFVLLRSARQKVAEAAQLIVAEPVAA